MKISYPNFALKAGINNVALMLALLLLFTFNAAAQTGVIRGTVVMKQADGTTVPVSGATVDVYRVDVSATYPSARTTQKGMFSLIGLPLGAKFVLSVSAPGAKPDILPGFLTGMDAILITLEPGDGRRFTQSEVQGAVSMPSETKKNTDTTSQANKNTDGFMGIKYGTSIAEARKIIADRQLGKIEEAKSYSNLLTLSKGKTDYVFESDHSRYTFLEDLDITLFFVDDKFYQATIVDVMSETIYKDLFIMSGGKKDPLSEGFENIKKDFDRIYYKTEIYKESTVKENGMAIWEFKQPQGQPNYIALTQKDNRLFLTFQNTDLFNLSEKRQKDYESAKVNFAAAERYRGEKRYDLAVAEYSQTLRLDPDHVEAYHWRGHSYMALDKYELAVADFTSALKYEPESLHYLNDRAAAYAGWSETKFELALADLAKAIKLKPNEARPYLLRAKIFCAMGKKDLAAADEKDAISLGGTVKQKCGQ